MRRARIKSDGAGFYHVMSRVIDRQAVLDPREKEAFRKLMRKLEAFCGLQILTYSLMSNHFHVLIKVPERRDLSDEELVERLSLIYAPPFVKEIEAQLADLRKDGADDFAEKIKARYTRRMFDISEFMKALKQQFAQRTNVRLGRKGTLWEERFKSILVERSEHALNVMAAYIDLNAVRAGMVKDPKDYRYCGYGEAMGGSRQAREGLALLMSEFGVEPAWRRVRLAYREFLYMQGEQKGLDDFGQPLRPGFTPQQVAEVLAAKGRLPLHEILRCRVRYFSDGLALGSPEFVEGIFGKYRERFGLKRNTGARPMKYGEWQGLCTLRNLRREVVSR